MKRKTVTMWSVMKASPFEAASLVSGAAVIAVFCLLILRYFAGG